MTSREVVEGRQLQGVDEQIAYKLTTTPFGSGPTGVSFIVKDITNRATDVTSTVMPGSAQVLGDIITLPVLKSLTDKHLYRIEIRFSSGGNLFEPYFYVQAEQ